MNNAYNAKTIDTNDIAQRIIDAMGDFHNDRLITGATLRSKTNYVNLIRAINDADVEVCRDSQILRQVVVYVPASTTSVPFDDNSRYLGEIVNNLTENEDITEEDQIYFLGKHDYLNVVEITDRYLELFDKYPVGAVQTELSIRKVSFDEFKGKGRYETQNWKTIYTRRSKSYKDRSVENLCTFVVDENRLLLGKGLENPGYLRFTGRIIPGVINTSKISEDQVDNSDYSAYKIVAPHTAMKLLLHSAIYHLLPISSADARQVAGASLAKERTEHLKMKPSDRNVVVPHFSI